MTINLELLKRITPEMIILLEKRYNILRAVKYHQPIGRRLLSERLKIGERIVRSEVDILREQQLLVSDSLEYPLLPKSVNTAVAELVQASGIKCFRKIFTEKWVWREFILSRVIQIKIN